MGTLQKTGGEYGEEKNDAFDLKRQIAPGEHAFIWNKINLPKIEKQPRNTRNNTKTFCAPSILS